MVYGPLYHAQQIGYEGMFLGGVLYTLNVSFIYFKGVWNKTIIPIGPVGYEMIIAIVAIYHLISTERAFVE